MSEPRPATPLADGAPGAANSAPDRAAAWYAVVLLSALSIMSLVDRASLSVVAQPLMADLQLTDSQLGLLMGVAFGAVYALVSLPIAHFLDFGLRIRVVSLGAVGWGLASVAAAFTVDFPSLAACRGVLAIAEAVLTPAALSIIPDLFSPRRRALPLAVFTGMPAISLPLALLGGGAALQVGVDLQAASGAAPWRVALAVLGLPSIVLGLLLWATVREPIRNAVDGADAPIGAREALAYAWSNGRFYVAYLVGLSALAAAFLGTSTWMPTAVVRAFGSAPAEAAKLIGLVALPATVAGSVLWPLAANRLEQRGLAGAAGMALIAISLLLGACGAAFGSLSQQGVVLIFAVMSFIFGGVPATFAKNLQMMTPPRLRARAATIISFAGSVVASALGPWIVAAIGERPEFQSPAALLNALALVWVSFGLVAVVAFSVALGPTRAGSRRELQLRP